MAGRGRGRGAPFAALSDGLGLGKGQHFDPVTSTDPPPIYPPLGSRPHYPLKDGEQEYMLAVMKDFVNQMRDSQFARTANDNNTNNRGLVVARFTDKIQVYN